MKRISKILIVLAVEIILKFVSCGILAEPEFDKSENTTNNIQKEIITVTAGFGAQSHAKVIKNNITKNKTALQATATTNISRQSVHSEANAKTSRDTQDQPRRTNKRPRKQTQIDQNFMIARSSSLRQYKPRNTSKQKRENQNYQEEALWSQYLLLLWQ